MKSRNVNAVQNSENNLKSIFTDTNSKTYNNTLKSPHSSNNLSEIQQKEMFSCQKFQGSSIDISFNETNKNKEEYDNYMLYKQYLISKTQYQKMISEIADIESKYTKNSNSIKKLESDLEELKKEKKQKKSDIINLLSNKESLEEIYKIKISSLINNSQIFNNPKINGKFRKKEVSMKKGEISKSNADNNNNSNNAKGNEYNPFETINILNDNDGDNNNIEIKIDDIKICDQKKYEEQLSNFCEDILQKKDTDLTSKLMQKLKIGYQVFFSEIKTPSIEQENIISNFFSRISVFISNKSRGKFNAPFIDSFLKQLLKINSINVRITEILSFLNKKYDEKKNEIKQKINHLTEKNENLKTKKLAYENKRKELKAFIDENKDKVKSTENNGIKIDKENTQCISFLLDNYFQDEFDNMNENKIYELPEPIKINSSKNNIFENNRSDNKISKIKDIFSNRGLTKGFSTEKKKMSMKNMLNMTNYKISTNENNDETDEGIVEKKESQIIGKLNSFIINKIPFNNENKMEIYENKEQNIDNNISSINVNNLIINNNLNIEKEKIINNKIENKEEEQKAEKLMIDQSNEKTNEDDHLNSYKYNNLQTEVKESHANKIKRILIPRDIQFDYLQKIKSHKSNKHVSPKNSNRLNNKNVILLPLNNSQIFNKSKSPSRAKTIINQNNLPSPRTNYFNNVTQGIFESSCYFKLSDKNSNGFNPLNNVDVNPITLNYFEGSIKIEKVFNKLKISQKSANKYIGLELKDIVNISLNKQMENIVKIYNIYLKEGKNQENFDVNKFILTKEIKEIRMQQNEKIKAINCKLFCFSILLEKKFIPKVEFIFNNYDDFNAWYNCLQHIVKLNCPEKEKK